MFKPTGLALASILAMSGVCVGQEFKNVQLTKEPTADGRKADLVSGSLKFNREAKEIQFTSQNGAPQLVIKYDAIKRIEYERASRPRYTEGILIAWPLLLTKSKKHYLTIQYMDSSGAGHYAIMRLDKSNCRDVIAEAEAQTGKKVERLDEP
jgi:hypothetical protein